MCGLCVCVPLPFNLILSCVFFVFVLLFRSILFYLIHLFFLRSKYIWMPSLQVELESNVKCLSHHKCCRCCCVENLISWDKSDFVFQRNLVNSLNSSNSPGLEFKFIEVTWIRIYIHSSNFPPSSFIFLEYLSE